MSDNQRVLDLAAEIRRVDGNHSLGAAALAEELEPWLDAVVAAVREDLGAKHAMDLVASRLWAFDQGRQAAARDIRATPELSGDLTLSMREHYARIAEGHE